MNKVQHSSCNHVFGAPKGWDQKELPCDALPVKVGAFEGFACITSFWKPSAEELFMLNNGGVIVLHILSGQMPPVSLAVTTTS